MSKTKIYIIITVLVSSTIITGFKTQKTEETKYYLQKPHFKNSGATKLKLKGRQQKKINAKKLQAAYQGDVVKADKKYKNKKLIVTGPIYEIRKDAFGDVFVLLDTADADHYIYCYFDDKKSSPQLKKGGSVSLIGKFKGSMGGLLIMKHCKFK